MAMIYNSQLDAFELYHQVRQDGKKGASSSTTGTALRALSDGLSGSAGAAISNVATYPLDLIITRLQIQRQLRKNAAEPGAGEYKGLVDAAQKIIQKDGWTGLYAGLASDTGKTIMDSFLFFLMYDFMRKRRLGMGGQSRKSLPAMEELGVGFVAGSLTKLCTTPIATVVTRKQAAALTSTNPSIRQIAQDIKDEKGSLGFWSGYSASLILTLNPSLTFFLFETLKRLLLPRSKRENPPPTATFFLAAISKACASSVTYPFSLAKARVQAGNVRKESTDEKATVDEKVHTGPKTKRAAQTTIFSTLLTIANNEGVAGLYEGVHLEVLKAFFSHGTTMLVKQAIQKLFLRIYYIMRIVYQSWTGQADLNRIRMAKKAKKSGNEYYDLAIKRTSERMEDVKRAAQEATIQASKQMKDLAAFVEEYVPMDDDIEGEGGISKWLDNRLKK